MLEKRPTRAIASNEDEEKIKLKSSLPAGMLIDKIPLAESGLNKSCICQMEKFEFVSDGTWSEEELQLPDATI